MWLHKRHQDIFERYCLFREKKHGSLSPISFFAQAQIEGALLFLQVAVFDTIHTHSPLHHLLRAELMITACVGCRSIPVNKEHHHQLNCSGLFQKIQKLSFVGWQVTKTCQSSESLSNIRRSFNISKIIIILFRN
jgi:hypothetical protein